MNVNENIRNEREITEKLRCVPTKLPILPIYQLLTILDCQNCIWLMLRQSTLTFMVPYAKDLICIFMNMNENI